MNITCFVLLGYKMKGNFISGGQYQWDDYRGGLQLRRIYL